MKTPVYLEAFWDSKSRVEKIDALYELKIPLERQLLDDLFLNLPHNVRKVLLQKWRSSWKRSDRGLQVISEMEKN